MDISQLLALGATVVGGQIDFRNEHIGYSVGGHVEFTERGRALMLDVAAEIPPEPPAEKEPAPAPVKRAKKVAKPPVEQAPPEDPLTDLDSILGV